MDEPTGTIDIQIIVDGESNRCINITQATLMRKIALYTGELRFLLPAYKKCLMPDESEDSKMFCELLVNMIPSLFGIKTKGIAVEDLIEKIDKLTQATLSYCAIMDAWVGREVKTIITIKEPDDGESKDGC